MDYKTIGLFIKKLGRYRNILTKQQIKTIKGQALSGDLEGAEVGLERLLAKQTLK